MKHLRVLLPFLSSVLLILAFPGFNLFPVAWLALIPLLFSIERQGGPRAFVTGFTTGTAAYAGLLYWLYPMMLFNTGSWLQSAAVLLALSSYLGLYVGAWAFLFRAAGIRSILPGALYAAFLWVALEYLRTQLLTGFPWLLTGYSQWPFRAVIQVSEYAGVYGVSFLIIFVNAALSGALRVRRVVPAAVAVAAVLIAVIYGNVALFRHATSAPPYIKVAVVQGSIDQYKKWDDAYAHEILRTYTGLVRAAAGERPDVIVWPETAVPGYLPADPRMYSWVSALARESGAYNIVGTPFHNGGRTFHNASMLFGPQGEVLSWHLKTHLVPFGEYVPLRKHLEPYFGVLNSLGDFTPGTRITLLPIKSVLWGTSICSENFFGDVVRRTVRKGAGIIVNQTNDAWYFKTAAPEQHFIMNVFRAVENRRTVVVAGNTGVSGIVTPTGSVRNRMPLFSTDYFTALVSPRKTMTFYTLYGDIFATICSGAAAVFLLAGLMRAAGRRRKRV